MEKPKIEVGNNLCLGRSRPGSAGQGLLTQQAIREDGRADEPLATPWRNGEASMRPRCQHSPFHVNRSSFSSSPSWSTNLPSGLWEVEE